MVTVGSLNIPASIDTAELDKGFRQILNSFRQLERDSKVAMRPLERIGDIADGMATAFTAVGSAGIAAMTGLAAKAPAVSPALARMQQQFMRMSHFLGRELKPIFDSLASNLLPAITEAIVNNEDKIKAFVGTVSTGIKNIGGAIQGDIDSIKNLVPTTGFMALGAAAGLSMFGPKGMFLGAALGAAAENAIIPSGENVENLRESLGDFAETGSVIGQTGQDIKDSPIKSVLFPLNSLNLSELASNVVVDTVQFLIGKTMKKDADYSDNSGVSR